MSRRLWPLPPTADSLSPIDGAEAMLISCSLLHMRWESDSRQSMQHQSSTASTTHSKCSKCNKCSSYNSRSIWYSYQQHQQPQQYNEPHHQQQHLHHRQQLIQAQPQPLGPSNIHYGPVHGAIQCHYGADDQQHVIFPAYPTDMRMGYGAGWTGGTQGSGKQR